MEMYIFILLIALDMTSWGQGQIVDTQYGQVEGNTVQLEDGPVVVTFYSIPYAKPPLGQLRFQAPEEPEPWGGVLDARSLPPACPQDLNVVQWPADPHGIQMQEDCLYLNIYTPSVEPVNLPVMVWIHGGGYQNGLSVLHPGHFLAAKLVVVVSINYRLRAFGFMSSGDAVASGNYGLLDQIRALEFVRDNIAAFGGNPDKVTIFGESAGASSCGLLGLSPLAEGLFHQIITQSGSDQYENSVNSPGQNPEEYTQQVAAQLGCPTDNTEGMMDCLRELPWEVIWNVGFQCAEGYRCLGFAPVVDGIVVPDHPWKMRKNGQFARVPLLSGINTEDGSFIVPGWAPETSYRGLNRSEFLHYLREGVNQRLTPHYPDKEQELFDALNFFYSPWPNVDDPDKNRHALVELMTDFTFGATGDMQMESQASTSPVYHYIFGYSSDNKLYDDWMGVVHAEELTYVFGTPLLQRNPSVREDSQIWEDHLPWNEEDIEWSEFIMHLWTNFAKFGDPTPAPITPPGGAEPITWDQKSVDSHLYLYMHRGDTDIQENYRSQHSAFWRFYLPDIICPEC